MADSIPDDGSPIGILQSEAEKVIGKWDKKGYSSLSKEERFLFLVWAYVGQVDNGGHSQFFFNSTGEYARDTDEVLREIGASEYAMILHEAIALFPDGVLADLDERNEALESLPESADESWEQLDKQFYELGSDNLLMILYKYLHPPA